MRISRLRAALSAAVIVSLSFAAAGCGDTAEPAAAPSTSTSAAAPPPTPAAATSTAPARLVTGIQTPDSLGSRKKITDATHTKLATDAETAIKAQSSGLLSAVVAYYGTTDPSKDKMYLYGASLSNEVTTGSFERSLADLTKNLSMSDIQTPDQGALGGSAKCAQIVIQKLPTAACGWYIKYQMVFVLWYNHTPSQLAAELPAIRGAVEISNK